MSPNKPDSQEIIIKKSNELIEARYRLTIGEQRLILLLASQIRTEDTGFNSYEIRVSDFAEMFDLGTDKSLYKKVEQAAAELLGKKLFLKNDSKNFEATVWLSYVKYVRGSGTIKLRFDDSLKPYLLQLKDTINITDGTRGFTQYQLGAVMNFKSAYSIRLYEVLKMEVWKAKKAGKNQFEKTFLLDEYRQLLGVEKKSYNLFSAFRIWTIEPPVKEISEQTDLEIFETKYIKEGRKVTGVCFVVLIKDEKQKKANIEKIEKEEQKREEEQDGKQEIHKVIKALIDNGFSFENAKTYKTKYGIKQIERNLVYMQAEERNGKKIENRPAYLASAIREDWGQYREAEMKAKAEQEAKRTEAERKAVENQTTLDQQIKANYERAFSVFEGMEKTKQEELIFEYSNSVADDFSLEQMRKAEKKGESIFTVTIVRKTFTKFLIDRGV